MRIKYYTLKEWREHHQNNLFSYIGCDNIPEEIIKKLNMIINTKKPSNFQHSEQYHIAYGIQIWLLRKGFIVSKETKNKVDADQYKELLKEFCLSQEGFDITKIKNIHSYERYVQNRFKQFCTFTCNKYRKQ